MLLPLFLTLASCGSTSEKTSSDESLPVTLTFTPVTPSLTPIPPTATPTSSTTASPTEEPSPSSTPTPPPPKFSFVVNGDMAFHSGPGEFDTPQYFRGMCESIATLPNVAFMLSVGDLTPPWDARWTIDQYLGADFLWFPIVGNHDVGAQDMQWLREYSYDPNGPAEPNITRSGPPGCERTTFSFDYQNAHFVILNIYCDLDNETRTDGAIVDHLYEWLQTDLQATQQEHIFVFGHEPAFPWPDDQNGIVRHLGESLDQYPITRDRFWALLKEFQVNVYFTGHTHSFSVADIEGVWQVDIAHSMGARTQATRSTYVLMQVEGSDLTYTAYRVNNFTDVYEIAQEGSLSR